jgi:predicted nucleotidyltransferase
MISFRSEVTKKILNYFFINPHENLYVNELSRKLHLDKRNLVKKIRELEKKGLLLHQSRGNLKLYAINKKYPLYNEYRKIIMTTVGFQGRLKNTLEGMRGIAKAYIYGSYAKGAMDSDSDIDLLIVGSGPVLALHKQLNKIQRDIGREINVTNMDESEFKKRIKAKDPFLNGVIKQKHVRII